MFYHIGFILVLAAAAAAVGPKRSQAALVTTEKQKVWTMYSTPPPNDLDPKFEYPTTVPVWVKPTKVPEGSGELVIVGYEPIYERLNKTRDNGPRVPADWDFQCPKRFGYYRYEQSCEIYIECRNYRSSLKVCPDGMKFKGNPRWSEYPCAYPPEAKCISRSESLPPRPTVECPRQFGNFPIANELFSRYDRCSSYISCSSGVAHVMNCTFGLVFNPAIGLCDWPERVPGCDDVFEFQCPVALLGEEDMVINYRYPHDHECRYFYSCLNGNYRVLACDEGLLFDSRIGRCVEYDSFICDYKLRRILPEDESLQFVDV